MKKSRGEWGVTNRRRRVHESTIRAHWLTRLDGEDPPRRHEYHDAVPVLESVGNRTRRPIGSRPPRGTPTAR